VTISVLLWDFGDTLVDERWMLKPSAEFDRWPEVWTDVVGERARDWNTGRISESDIFGELARRSGMDISAIERYVAACCESIRFNRAAWRAACERRRPQALVTVNPDLFIERVARPYGLAAHFDAIVVSCEEGTDDKSALCGIALDRLGFSGSSSEALLIDNRRDLADAWAQSGGVSYHFRGDKVFDLDWPAILEGPDRQRG
jgi:FMN phosphatase YigB (HAD superfamily)